MKPDLVSTTPTTRLGTTATGPLALTAYDLRAIADAVDHLGKVPACVNEIDVGQHRVTLERHSDLRDGDSYTVTGIERADGGEPERPGRILGQ